MIHITLSNVKKSYALCEGKRTILKGISLSFEKGDYVAIIGASGSGKSTLMHILGCMDQAFDSEYLLDDKPVHRITPNPLAELRRTKFGFIFQTFNLAAKLTTRKNVALSLIYNRIKKREGIAERHLEAMGLGHRLDPYPAQLSGGERQRVDIDRALVNDPQIILADESVLRHQHKLRAEQENDFRIRSQVELMESISKSFTILLGSIAFISPLVGDIGIMNILLVSVTERTKEIGIRKAIGAYENDILHQFLIESIPLCTIGGLVGILLGVGISYLVRVFSSWKPIVSSFSILLSLGVSLSVGIGFGFFPALKAARMNPVDTLRHE